MSLFSRLTNLFRPDRLGRDIDRELRFHVDELVDSLVAGGMSEADARREARRRFGHRQVHQERVRDVDMPGWLDAFVADTRYALRGLRSRPGFATVIVLSLALGIGANTAIFSLINAVLLRSLPVRDPESLVMVTMDDGTIFTNPIWEAVREQQDALAGVFAVREAQFDLTNGGVVRSTTGAYVSGDYFNVLGVGSARGRVLQSADDARGCAGAAVLSHGFWQREYGGAPDAIGRTISLDGHAIEIVGVAAAGFTGVQVGSAVNVFLPICALELFRPGLLEQRSHWAYRIFGRLGPGTTLTAAQTRLGAVATAVYEASIPTHWTPADQAEFVKSGLTARAAPNGVSSVRTRYRGALLILLGVVGVVLVIACGNVAQLLMARAATREHEMALRLAIGSSRARLVRQVLTESVILSLAGAALGLLFARWSSALLVGYLGGSGGVTLDLSLDGRVLAFTVTVALTTGILFGVVPAWRSARIDPQSAMRGVGRGLIGSQRQRALRSMVVGQLALSLVLVVAAGLLGGSLRRLTTLDPGFQRDGVLLVELDWSRLQYDEARQVAFRGEVLERLRALPGVQQSSASMITPIGNSSWNNFIAVDGYAPKSERDALVWFNGISEGYLDALGTELLTGRDFTSLDRRGSEHVALVNQTMARRFFGDANPVGRQFRIDQNGTLGDPMTIVGVVEDSKYGTLNEETLPQAFQPLDQAESWGPSINVALRTGGDPTVLVAGVTAAMREVNPLISLSFTTLQDQVTASLAQPRLLATLSGFFGMLALLLAVLGLYGVMSYGVSRRRGEIGVRIALGASRGGVLRLVAREAVGLVVLGVALGVPLTLASVRLVSAFLYGVAPTDPTTLTGSALALGAVALLAAAIPAWRAAAVDPMVALRKE